MSLQQEEFLREWMKLEGSFSRVLSGKIRDAWYEEVELTEYYIFKKTIRNLALGYHFTQKSSAFPRFKDFWVIYKMVEHDLKPAVVEKKKGCEKCVGGLIYFLKKYRLYSEPIQVIGYCRHCHPDRLGSLDPDDAYNYVPGMEPENHQDRVLLPVSTNRALYLEFMEKWKNHAGTDWKAETEKALAMHHKAVAAMKGK